MTTNNDALRKAWTYLIDVWPADSKSMNRLALARETLAAAIAAASKPEPQAQAGEPEDDLTVAYMCGVEAGKDHMREAIAKKDAALKACVEALENANASGPFPMFTSAINQSKEALK